MPLWISSTEAEGGEGKPKWIEIFKCLSSNSSVLGGTGRPEDRNCPFSKPLKLEISTAESRIFKHFPEKEEKIKGLYEARAACASTSWEFCLEMHLPASCLPWVHLLLGCSPL